MGKVLVGFALIGIGLLLIFLAVTNRLTPFIQVLFPSFDSGSTSTTSSASSSSYNPFLGIFGSSASSAVNDIGTPNQGVALGGGSLLQIFGTGNPSSGQLKTGIAKTVQASLGKA